jgi:hypothetical protein
VDGREIVVDAELDLGQAVGRQADVLDLADRPAADHHLVAVDELAGALELGGDLVATAAAEHQDSDQQDRRDHRDDRNRARESGTRLPAPSSG